MRKIVLSDSTREVMLDAIDLYGVYSYYAYDNVDGVMFVVMDNIEAMATTKADVYLRERCPEWVWVVIAEEWLNRENMESTQVFDGGDWSV